MLLKSGIIVGLGTLISRIAGYIRDIFIAAYLGTGIHAEAFAIALKLPNFFRTIFAEGAFSAAFIPIFSGKYSNDGKNSAVKFANSAFILLVITLSIVTIIVEIFMPSIVKILASGFYNHTEKFSLTVCLSRITFPYLIFISLVTLYNGILNSIGKFAIASIIPVVLNLVMIATLTMIPEHILKHSESLSLGVTIAGIVQLIIIIIASYNSGIKLKINMPRIDDSIKKLFKNMLPVILGSSVVQINLWVGTIIATHVSGVVSILYYAERLNQFPLAIIGTAIATILLPSLSKLIRNENYEKANEVQNSSLIVCLMLTLPCVIILFSCSDIIISVLFERKAFLMQDTIKVGQTLSILSLGLPAFVMIKIFTPRYFAALDTKTPVFISIICIIVNLSLSYLLIEEHQHLAIAIAATISGWLNLLLLAVFLIIRKQFYFTPDFYKKFSKIIFSSIFMIIILYYVHNLLNMSIIYGIGTKVMHLLIYMFSGGCTYLLAIILLKIFDIKLIRKSFKE